MKTVAGAQCRPQLQEQEQKVASVFPFSDLVLPDGTNSPGRGQG